MKIDKAIKVLDNAIVKSKLNTIIALCDDLTESMQGIVKEHNDVLDDGIIFTLGNFGRDNVQLIRNMAARQLNRLCNKGVE